MKTQSNVSLYFSILSPYMDFIEINKYSLYKNNYITEIPVAQGKVLDIICSYTYGTNVSSAAVSLKQSSFFDSLYFVFFNHIVVFLFLFVLFFIVFSITYNRKVFKPFVVFFRKVVWESEQNLISLEDFFIVLSFYIAYVIHFGSLFIPVMKLAVFFYKVNKYLVYFFSVLVGFLPLYFTYQASIFIFYYLKGVSNDRNMYVMSVNDVMGKLSSLLRYLVQSIRWFLFFLFLFAFHIFLYEIKHTSFAIYTFSLNTVNTCDPNYTIFTGFNNNIIVYCMYTAFRVYLELLDFIFVAVVQLSAFLIVLFWLLGFLFSNQIPSIFEFFFYEYKKSSKFVCSL